MKLAADLVQQVLFLKIAFVAIVVTIVNYFIFAEISRNVRKVITLTKISFLAFAGVSKSSLESETLSLKHFCHHTRNKIKIPRKCSL